MSKITKNLKIIRIKIEINNENARNCTKCET